MEEDEKGRKKKKKKSYLLLKLIAGSVFLYFLSKYDELRDFRDSFEGKVSTLERKTRDYQIVLEEYKARAGLAIVPSNIDYWLYASA